MIGHSLGGKVVLELLSQLAKQDAPVPQQVCRHLQCGKNGLCSCLTRVLLPWQVWSLDSPVGQAVPGSEEPTEIDRVLQVCF